MDYKKVTEDLVNWLREKAEDAGAKGFVFGLSGGIDSAVVAGLSKRVFPDNSLGLIMPCESIDEDREDAIKVSEALDLETKTVDLTNTYRELIKASFSSENRMARSNIKPRLRMTTIYYYAQDLGYLVLGPSNASEWYLGYSTKYGDSGADLMPIVNILKTDVFEIAKELGIPDEIINKKPSAGLWVGQTDEDEMGFTYDELDSYIRGEREPEKDKKEKIDRMHRLSHHKREMAPKFILKN